jgi:hypothetical protein
LTPTVAASVDFLNTFSATYDNYLILGTGLIPSSLDQLSFQFANAGTADSGSKYYQLYAPNGNSTTLYTFGYICGDNIYTSGRGLNFVANICNANSTTSDKSYTVNNTVQDNATRRAFYSEATVYSSANAISGMHLFWAGAANFTAVGKIRIYGYSNS